MLSVFLSGILAVAGDTLSLAPAVVSSIKEETGYERMAAPGSRITIEEKGFQHAHSLSQQVPGLHIPDYGASLTSTIYIRGLGSRMENPAMGFYLDDIPVLDKNAYDFDWYGLRSGALLRGPQGTLYGRNSMGGVLLLKTPSAREQDGIRGMVETGTAGYFHAGVAAGIGSHYLSGSIRHTEGYFTNAYSGRQTDPFWGGSLRWRWDRSVSETTTLSHSLHMNYSDEGGFAYGRYTDGQIHPVNYNDEGSYRRLTVLDGWRVRHRGETIHLNSVTSLQILADRMRMDQDYTPESIFTLEQRQRNIALTQEFILTPTKLFRHWKPQTGFFCFGKMSRMGAPVRFKEDGIRTLILGNANRNIPEEIGYLDITEKSFPVDSDFSIWSWNAALYHQSVWERGRWMLTAGIRLDYEGSYMGYDSRALVHYRFAPFMSSDKLFRTAYQGSLQQHFFQILPKVSALYTFLFPGSRRLIPYGNISKGFRAGGFNTQIFSDILQGLMMNGIMDDLGVHLDNPPASVDARHTKYRPEEAWNYEIGLRYRRGDHLSAEVNAYYIDCRNQQLTVFPPGKATGRMMTNAGRSGSIGIEAELDYRLKTLHSCLSYSWCHAAFREYRSGGDDYSGKRVPYVPEHSFYIEVDKQFHTAGYEWALGVDFRGAGPIWWNEENTRFSPVSVTVGGLISVTFGHFTLYLRGENLSDRAVPAFYFKSIGNEFFALSKPRRLTIGIKIK